MTEFIVKLLRRGTVTIPNEICETEKLKEGDYLKLTLKVVKKTKTNKKSTQKKRSVQPDLFKELGL